MAKNSQSILITGGASGYGQAIALELSSLGHKVYIASRRFEKLKEISDKYENIEALKLDLREESSILEALSKIDKLDILINNSAIPPNKSLIETSSDEWNDMINTNLRGQWLITKHSLTLLKNSQNPKILFTGSEAGFSAKNGLYGITKMALNSLATSLAIEQKDIQINVLIADEAKTEMNQISKTSPKTILPMLKKILFDNGLEITGKIFHSNGTKCYFLNNATYEGELN